MKLVSFISNGRSLDLGFSFIKLQYAEVEQITSVKIMPLSKLLEADWFASEVIRTNLCAPLIFTKMGVNVLCTC